MKPLLLFVLLLPACAGTHGFDQGLLRREIAPTQVATEDEIARVLAIEPQLPTPFRLGVVLRSVTERNWSTWEWTAEDKELILTPLRELIGRGVLSDVVLVSESTVGGDDLKAVRLAAARHGADAVLLISAGAAVRRWDNWGSLLYLTIIGAWLVPGTEAEVLFLANGSLWDVRNEFLYATIEADGRAADSFPAAIEHIEGLVDDARTQALSALAESLRTRVDELLDEGETAAAIP